MISKGTQYLTAAGFGNIRVTAASMGKAVVFGSLWLNGAAQQAIMVAFGADGAAVINATNAYLNGIAATDKSKAQALAGFINEDPMMVCSLPMSEYLPSGFVMPRRYIELDGNSWFDTGYAFSSMSQVTVNVELKRTNMATVGNNSGSWAGLLQWTTTLYVNNISAGSYSAGWAEVIFTPTWLTYNGSAKRTYNTTFNSSNLWIGKMNSATNSTNKFENVKFLIGDVEHIVVPYIHKDGENLINEMLDITAVVALENQGTGTPTIPDISYTPPTP